MLFDSFELLMIRFNLEKLEKNKDIIIIIEMTVGVRLAQVLGLSRQAINNRVKLPEEDITKQQRCHCCCRSGLIKQKKSTKLYL